MAKAGQSNGKNRGIFRVQKKEISLISAKKKIIFSFDILSSEEDFHFSNKEEKRMYVNSSAIE